MPPPKTEEEWQEWEKGRVYVKCENPECKRGQYRRNDGFCAVLSCRWKLPDGTIRKYPTPQIIKPIPPNNAALPPLSWNERQALAVMGIGHITNHAR
jgi:hypothetical protein